MVGKSERAGGRGDVGVWRLRSFGHLRWSRPESKTRTLSDALRMTAQLDMRNVRVASAVAGVDGVKRRQDRRTPNQRKPDQSSATRIESVGLEGSYLMLAGWPATSLSKRTWLSRPVMSCAV